MQRNAIIAVLAFGLLATPLAVETLTSPDPFNALEFGMDLFELTIFAATIATVSLLVFNTRDLRREQDTLVRGLTQARVENERWRDSMRAQIDGFRNAIACQFDEWGLTAAERDVASLMLKGCTHKQIADARRSNESTVRQQAQSIYRKSHLQNRAELAAYFLDAVLQANGGGSPDRQS